MAATGNWMGWRTRNSPSCLGLKKREHDGYFGYGVPQTRVRRSFQCSHTVPAGGRDHPLARGAILIDPLAHWMGRQAVPTPTPEKRAGFGGRSAESLATRGYVNNVGTAALYSASCGAGMLAVTTLPCGGKRRAASVGSSAKRRRPVGSLCACFLTNHCPCGVIGDEYPRV